MQFEEIERVDGCRLSWNMWPNSKLGEAKLSVPLGLLYSPSRQLTELGLAPYKPSICTGTNCGAILNPYCNVYYDQRQWMCCFCQTRNAFSPQIAQATNEYRIPETIHTSTTMEYIIDNSSAPPVFVFVVDTVLIEAELKSLVDSIKQAILLLPENAIVGLITYGQYVYVHEVTAEYIPISHMFPDASPDTASIMNRLNLKVQATSAQTISPEQKTNDYPPPHTNTNGPAFEISGLSRFLAPLSECLIQLTNILDDLTYDQQESSDTMRPYRNVGAALKIAQGLCEIGHKNNNARILTFLGGPCVTMHPEKSEGQVAPRDTSTPIRSHVDISRDDAPLYEPACVFYTKLAAAFANNGHVVDIFACCLDQVGLAEMQYLVSKTGGSCVLDDSFTHGVFLGSMKRLLHIDPEEDMLSMNFAGEMQVMTSNELVIQGAVGQLTSLGRMSKCVDTKQSVGIGKTCAWYLGGLDYTSTYTIFFGINEKGAVTITGKPSQQGYIQIATKYKTSMGQVRIRVTTISKVFADASTEAGMQVLKMGFDQEAAAAVITKLAVHKLVEEPGIDIRRWIDRILIKLCAVVATYTKNAPNSFRLSSEFALFPQFMFYLRKSQLLQIFNCSPDETAFFRVNCLHEDTDNVVTMIQPRLYAYKLDSHPEPTPLDESSLTTDRILLLDTFFHLVIWYGGSVHKWQTDKLHLNPQYQNVAALLKAPLYATKERMDARFPTPRFIECVEGGSQARFILAKLDASNSKADPTERQLQSEDVTLKVFYEHLKKLVTEKSV